VVLNLILAALAFLSLALTLWQFVVAMRFPLHQRVADPGHAPPVTLLKPLKGVDAETWHCLESWLNQDYAGPVQILFGVGSADDPACEMARQLIAARPERNARLVICSESHGMNAKVSTLIQLFRHAAQEPTPGPSQPPSRRSGALARREGGEGNRLRKRADPLPSLARVGGGFPRSSKPTADQRAFNHDRVVIISDADVHVPPDFLANVVAPLRDDHAGLVSCFYRLANPATLAMQSEAIAINADFWSQVLQAQSLKPLDFALGAVMATTRGRLEYIGGFEALADYLADDYQLGNLIARRGGRIVLSPVVVECRESPKNWRAVWEHQLRWARTIRGCRPLRYFFSILSNATLWPLLWLIASFPSSSETSYATTVSGVNAVVAVKMDLLPKALLFALANWLARILAAMYQASKLTRSRSHWAFFWLVPIKDLLAAVVWALSFLGNSVEWRGRRYRVRRGGKLERVS
jgi:cellulose synthase/poly-beta-1,6-N-acetylglucosamine synthase-like glycosyltransferase